ncbi:MAG: undecaprenyl diphosphate synthase family protein, partial [Spirochaetota bacterium]
GGRDEIIRAVNRWLHNGRDTEDLSAKALCEHLDVPELPEPDMLIRTGGELRLSNFLLWECAYSELVFMDVLWPDFDRDHLVSALLDYQRRERRFGATTCGT